jgi:hypothetical protein
MNSPIIEQIIAAAKSRISGLTIAQIAFEGSEACDKYTEEALNQAKAAVEKTGWEDEFIACGIPNHFLDDHRILVNIDGWPSDIIASVCRPEIIRATTNVGHRLKSRFKLLRLVFKSPVIWTGNWTGLDRKIDLYRPDFWSGCPES